MKTVVAAELHAHRTKVLLAQGQHEATIRESRLAIELLRARGGKEIELVVALCSEGLALLHLGRVDEAVPSLERGMAAFAAAGGLGKRLIYRETERWLSHHSCSP